VTTQGSLFDARRVSRATGRIHAARLEHSPRLQRVLAVLQDARGRRLSTRDIIERAHVVAVNSAIHELRENGFDVHCERVSRTEWHYWLNVSEEATA